MSLGSAVRALFGRHERRIADIYRGLFMDLDDYARKIAPWAGQPARILEVGCGEGAVTEILARTFPDADILGIDLTPRVGRLYEGRRDGVVFKVATIQDVALAQPGQFDLVILSDVLHHIPVDLRHEILDAIGRAMAPGACFVLKDWSKTETPIHWLCHAGDRWLTGDKVSHLMPESAKRLVRETLPALRQIGEYQVKPWRNNYALVFAA